MDKEMDFMKIGLYALAGFGAFAVYNKYMGGDKAADVIVEVEKLCGKGQVYIQMLQEEQWERQKLEGLYSILGLQETIEEK